MIPTAPQLHCLAPAEMIICRTLATYKGRQVQLGDGGLDAPARVGDDLRVHRNH